MNRVSLLPTLLLLLTSAGCYVNSYDGGADYEYDEPSFPGDVTLSWRFAGYDCYQAPEVQSVRVHIPGEILANDGVYPCSVNGFPGITLHDFGPGYYTYTVEAVGYMGETLYGGSGTFVVDGDVNASIDLAPAGFGDGYAYVSWSFPPNDGSPNPSCTQAGVSEVEVRIDGGAKRTFRCTQGLIAPGIETGMLSPGTHQIELTALSPEGYPLYAYDGVLQAMSGAGVANEYALEWNVGGAAVDWKLKSGGAYVSCEQGGVQDIYVNFMDAQGHMVYGSSGDRQPCAASPITYNFLLPGTYKVYVSGTGPGGNFLSDSINPPVVTVHAGAFVNVWNAVPVTLFRAN